MKKIFVILFLNISVFGYAAEPIPVELKGVGIEEHLGQTISLDLPFTNEEGKTLPLRSYFDGKRPVVLMLIYYTCPNLCHFLLNGFMDSLKKMPWAQDKFDIVSVSINPRETPEVSLKRKQKLKLSDQWHFLTGKEKNIQTLAKEVGFHYRYDPDQKEYAHSAALFILTPEGKISRYLYGIQFKPLDLKLALLEASEGKIGSVMDRLLMFCYHYDPKGKKYALFASRLMSSAGILTVILISFLLIFLSKRRKTHKGHC